MGIDSSAQVDGKPQLRAGTIEEIVKWLIFGGVSEHVSAFLISFRAYGLQPPPINRLFSDEGRGRVLLFLNTRLAYITGTPAQLWNALMKVFDIVCEKERMSTMTKAELRKK